MVNHPWVDKAVHDNALVCEVLLQLHQEVSQPQIPQPPPPPPMPQPLPPPTMSQAPEQDAPMIYIDWGVRQPRSRRTEVRPVTARSEVIVGGSTNLVSKRGATSTGNLEKSGRRSLNRSNASRSKCYLVGAKWKKNAYQEATKT
ncbi:hypothetical protein Lser_V15G21145 [Lactuca serriola]